MSTSTASDARPGPRRQSRRVYIIWSRHCESCANVADEDDLASHVVRDAFCTTNGVNTSFYMGNMLALFLREYTNKMASTKNIILPNEVKFWASALPRAFQTAKLYSASPAWAAAGFRIAPGSLINRIPYISEGWNEEYEVPGPLFKYIDLSTTNTTTTMCSNRVAVKMNRLTPSPGLLVNEHIPLERETSVPYRYAYEDDYYKHFCRFAGGSLGEEYALTPDAVHIIVSHGWYLATNVVAPAVKEVSDRGLAAKLTRLADNAISNNESFLVSYGLQDGVLISPKVLCTIPCTPTKSDLSAAETISRLEGMYDACP